jgi:hypothetical protein
MVMRMRTPKKSTIFHGKKSIPNMLNTIGLIKNSGIGEPDIG